MPSCNIEHRREAGRKWRRLHPIEAKAASLRWYHANKKQAATRFRNWRAGNSPAAVRHRLIGNIRHLIQMAVRRTNSNKCSKTLELLGCSASRFKQYLESLFLPGMSWSNRSLWHIDHKTPICKFDLSTFEGQKAAFHYTNTQPLWALDNLRKGGRL